MSRIKNRQLFFLMVFLIPFWSLYSQVYQVIIFRGQAEDFRTHKLMITAEISPSRYFSHFDKWAEKMNVQFACNLPVRINLNTIAPEIPTTYDNLNRIIYNLSLENREPEFYERFQRKHDLFYDFLGYNPDIPMEFTTGLLTTYAYYQHVNRERVTSREFIEIFNFDYPELIDQLYFLEFSEYMGKIMENIPEPVRFQKLHFEFEEMPEDFQVEWNLPYSPLEFSRYKISLQLSGSREELKKSLQVLIDYMAVDSFIFSESQLDIEGDIILGLFYRSTS